MPEVTAGLLREVLLDKGTAAGDSREAGVWTAGTPLLGDLPSHGVIVLTLG